MTVFKFTRDSHVECDIHDWSWNLTRIFLQHPSDSTYRAINRLSPNPDVCEREGQLRFFLLRLSFHLWGGRRRRHERQVATQREKKKLNDNHQQQRPSFVCGRDLALWFLFSLLCGCAKETREERFSRFWKVSWQACALSKQLLSKITWNCLGLVVQERERCLSNSSTQESSNHHQKCQDKKRKQWRNKLRRPRVRPTV